jgi:glycosyltransferase involved in cell wall biosynthesis
VATISSSRGCPYRCAFCASEFYFSKRYRCRSATSVLGEIERLIADYRIDGLYFREDCFTVNRARVVEICGEMVRRKIALPWECEARVDTLDPELLRAMYEAGCRGMWCGIESGSPRILDYLQKGITLEQVRSAYRWAHEAGIAVGAGFMVGLPGETMEDAFRSLRLAKELRPCWAYFQSYVGYPRSRIYDEVEREGLFVRNEGGVFDVQTREMKRTEIRALENYFQKEFSHWQKSVSAGPPGADTPPLGGWPRVSVIVPARNAETKIEECLVSLVNLDYPKDRLELIMVDNGSTDRTREIASRFPVTVLVHDRTKSSYAARNTGLVRATGEIVAFTDSDCVATQSWLMELVRGCDDPGIGCFAGEIYPYRLETFIDEYLDSIGFMSQRQLLDYRPLPRAMTANLAFRREVFDRLGMFDAGAISGGDSEMVIRMRTKTEYGIRYNASAVVYHKHRGRLWPFCTQFVRYGWGEAKLTCSYREYYHPWPGKGLVQSARKIFSDTDAFLRCGRRQKGGEDRMSPVTLMLGLVRETAWHLGLQSGILYRLFREGLRLDRCRAKGRRG